MSRSRAITLLNAPTAPALSWHSLQKAVPVWSSQRPSGRYVHFKPQLSYYMFTVLTPSSETRTLRSVLCPTAPPSSPPPPASISCHLVDIIADYVASSFARHTRPAHCPSLPTLLASAKSKTNEFATPASHLSYLPQPSRSKTSPSRAPSLAVSVPMSPPTQPDPMPS